MLLPAFDPGVGGRRGRARRATLFFGVPTMYHRLVASGRADELGGLRLCVSGSAPLSGRLHAEASARLAAPVLERYGMTETLMNTSNPYDGERRAGTVGFPLPGVEVMLDDDEILVRGPNVFDGYWERPRPRRGFAPRTTAGRPGSGPATGESTSDGYLAIRGRSKELIITGGTTSTRARSRMCWPRIPGVVEVAVTGTPSDEWGEVVTAWIVSDGSPPTADDLAVFTEASLADYKRPRVVRVVDALPRNSLGKVVRSELARRDRAGPLRPTRARRGPMPGSSGRSADDGYGSVAGLDEVGRGAWAGPVSVGRRGLPTRPAAAPGLRDSKLLTEPRREALFPLITAGARHGRWAMPSRPSATDLGMTAALRLAARRALDGLAAPPDGGPDGREPRLRDRPGVRRPTASRSTPQVRTVVRGDATCISIAAASIVAKVTRDRLMRSLADELPRLRLRPQQGLPVPGAPHGPGRLRADLAAPPLVVLRGRPGLPVAELASDGPTLGPLATRLTTGP